MSGGAPDDEHRISRRSLLRGQLVRWVAPGPPAPAPRLRVPEAVAVALVALAGVEAGMQVLDVGESDLARTAARGADVTASAADAHDLPFADGAFDVVLCGFGTTPARSAARELVRVTCPGGVVALALRDGEARLEDLLDELETQTVGGWLLVRGRRPIPRV